VLAVLTTSTAAGAQQFIAPTRHTIIGSSEQSGGPNEGHTLYVANQSTVPVIVFGLKLSSCENVKQWCEGQRTKVAIPPGTRRIVGHVEPKSTERAFGYRWTFSYHADSSDAKMVALLRENGFIEEEALVTPGPVRRVFIDTTAPPDIEKPLSREPLTPEERGIRMPIGPRDTTPAPTFRFKVAYGSILGSTMMPGAPIQLTGPCINPGEAAKYDKDAKITRTPWRPPVYPMGFSHVMLPSVLKDSTLKSKEVLVRFVADSTGATIPESVSVLESPHGAVSVSACTAAISGKATPARDKNGQPIRAWVQMPVQVGW
jgi:hypothetical protein